METEMHSPQPWTQDDVYLMDSTRCVAARFQDRRDAAGVLARVNAHDALVAALTEARRFVEVDYTSRANDQEGAWAHRLLKQIDQALATH